MMMGALIGQVILRNNAFDVIAVITFNIPNKDNGNKTGSFSMPDAMAWNRYVYPLDMRLFY